jgi:hypothetical protein
MSLIRLVGRPVPDGSQGIRSGPRTTRQLRYPSAASAMAMPSQAVPT